MERARNRHRHRFRRVLEDVCVASQDQSLNNSFLRRNLIRCDSNLVKQFLIISAIVCICLSNLQPVISAEVGIREQNSESARTYRPILHRGVDAIGNSSRSRSDVGESSTVASVPGESSFKKVAERKHSNRASLHFDCKNCNNSTKDSGGLHLDRDAGQDTHKLEAILREIFLDELDDNAFQEDEDDEEVELTRDTHIPAGDGDDEDKLSRIARSHPEESSLFPEGRAFQGGKAKGTRSSPKGDKNKKKSGTSDLSKYNEYMDAVFNRMNTMIKKKRMDPLRVNLFAGPSGQKNKNKNKGKNSKAKNSERGKNKSPKHSPRMDLDSIEEEDPDEDEADSEDGPARKDIYLQVAHEDENVDHQDLDEEESAEEVVNHDEATVRKIRALLENAGNSSSSLQDPLPETEDSRGNESKPKKPKGSSSSKGSRPSNKSKDKGQKGNNANKKSQSQESQKEKNAKNKNKNKKQAQKSKPTRGILHGLSSLKRDGNVAVIRQGDKVRVVRANFLLGPVSLEILPKKSRSNDDTPGVAATATAPKLKGVLEVRLKKGAPTSIRKLRVYPPKSVKVDGAGGGSSLSSSSGKRKPQQYGKVTPMATARLRKIASTVVRQTDNRKISAIPASS